MEASRSWTRLLTSLSIQVAKFCGLVQVLVTGFALAVAAATPIVLPWPLSAEVLLFMLTLDWQVLELDR